MNHYVYKITQEFTNYFYFGSRSCKCDPKDDINYKGSMKTWRPDKKTLHKEILKIFNTREEAFIFESIIIKEHIRNELNRNYQIPNCRFTRHSMVTVKDKNGITSSVSKDDPRYLSGELEYMFKNKCIVKDKNGNKFAVSKDDPRYLSGELVGIAKGKIVVKDKAGKIFQIDKDDPRYLSGKLVGNCKGMVIIKDKNGKFKQVNKNDSDYLNGVYKHFSAGNIPVKDKEGNTFTTSIHDERLKTGELSHTTKDKRFINNGIVNKFINKDSVDFFIKLGWKKGILKKSKKGLTHHNSKFNENDIIEIRKLIEENISSRMIAKKFNVSHQVIGRIRKNKTYENN